MNGRARAAVLLLAIGACAGRPAPPAATAVRPSSVFDRPWTWRDEDGAPVQLGRWRGRTLIVSFVYTTCTEVCPMTVERLRRLDARLQGSGRSAEFVLLTLDPWTDGAPQLRAWKTARRLPERWHLLRASYPQTHALADLLQVRLIDDGGHVIHDGTIAVLDATGRPLGHVPD